MRRYDVGRLAGHMAMLASVSVGGCVRATAFSGAEVESRTTATGGVGTVGLAAASPANRISAAQLDGLEVTTIANAIVRLRPEWLRPAGGDVLFGDGQPVVYVDGTFIGGTAELGRIPRERVSEVQLLTPAAAYARFGRSCQCSAGVILVLGRLR